MNPRLQRYRCLQGKPTRDPVRPRCIGARRHPQRGCISLLTCLMDRPGRRIRMRNTHRFAGFSGATCFAKEDPDTDASLASRGAAGNGLVIKTSTLALWSDPTLSARCDESQLLLGIPRRLTGSTNRKIPTAEPYSCVFSDGSAGAVHTSTPSLWTVCLRLPGYPHIGFLKC